MKDSTIKSKVKVFVSSTCDDKYNLARKALAALLEETNITQVYLFEDDTAHSLHIEESYIGSLDDSDICIFLIDNYDGIRPAVLSEHNRAQMLKKKCLYVFCDQKEKEPTQLQTELRESGIVRFKIVHEFTDFPMIAYLSALNDIVYVYRNYCRSYPDKQEQQILSENQSLNSPSKYNWDKTKLHGFIQTESVIFDIFDHSEKNLEGVSCTLDSSLRNLLAETIGKQNDLSISFKLVTEELAKYHNGKILDIVQKRWKAIESYYSGNILECIRYLTEAFELSKEDPSIPEWIVSDILIDLRNIQIIDNENKNIISVVETQSILMAQSFPVYYPILDRMEKELNSSILEETLKYATKEPYTVFFGGELKNICYGIANMFIVAAIHGSLTHILQTNNRIIAAMSSLCIIYDDHEIYVELLRNLILTQNKKDYDKFERIRNQRSDEINQNDAQTLWAATINVPIAQKRFISELVAWSRLCYYFSDEKFLEISNMMMQKIRTWILDDNRLLNAGETIFRALLPIINRFDNTRIAVVMLLALNKELYRFNDEIYLVLQKLDLTKLDESVAKNIIEVLIEQASNNILSSHSNRLQYTLLAIRLVSPLLHDEIDTAVKSAYPTFFEGIYSLSVFSDNKIQHIERYIDDIRKQNSEQGQNGTYHGYANNPHHMIIRILYNDEWIDSDLAIKVYQAARETLLSERQTVDAKSSAIELIIEILCRCLVADTIKEDIRITLADERVYTAETLSLINRGTSEPMLISLMLLKLCNNDLSPSKVLEAILSIHRDEPADLIAILSSIGLLLKRNDLLRLDNVVISAFIQFASEMSMHKDREVRSKSIDILFTLYNTEFSSLSISILSKIMDKEIDFIKVRILQNVDGFGKEHPDKVDYIINKGLSDNSYLVRKISKKYKKAQAT